MFGETITRYRKGTPTGMRDGNGNPILNVVTPLPIVGVAPAPGTLEEQAEQYGPRSADRWTLYKRGHVPMDLLKDDLVTFRGEAGWQVVGDAKVTDWQSPYSGTAAGSVAEIRRAS